MFLAQKTDWEDITERTELKIYEVIHFPEDNSDGICPAYRQPCTPPGRLPLPRREALEEVYADRYKKLLLNLQRRIKDYFRVNILALAATLRYILTEFCRKFIK